MTRPSDEEDDTRYFAVEADAETVTVTLGPDFFNDVDTVAFDKRVEVIARGVRNALYVVAGTGLTHH